MCHLDVLNVFILQKTNVKTENKTHKVREDLTRQDVELIVTLGTIVFLKVVCCFVSDTSEFNENDVEAQR